MSQTYEDRPTLAAWNAMAPQLVKLYDDTLTEAVTQYDLPLSGMGLGDYLWLLVAVECTTTPSTQNIYVRFNNDSSKNYSRNSGSGATAMDMLTSGMAPMFLLLRCSPYGGQTFCLTHYFTSSGSHNTQECRTYYKPFPQLTTINFYISTTQTLPLGTRFSLYGLKY